MSISGASGDLSALTFKELSASNTDAGLESTVVSFVGIAVRDEVGYNTFTVDVTNEAKDALTTNTIEGAVGRAGLAAASDPEVSRLALALTVAEDSIDATVLVGGALATNHSVSGSADAALLFLVKDGVGRAVPSGLNALVTNEVPTVAALASSVDVFLIPLAERFTSTTNSLVSGLAEALSSVMVVVVSGRTECADTTDADIGGLADALLGHLAEVFVEALAGNSATGLSELVISLTSQAARAGTLN